jgi:hypothetical protein
LDIPKEQRKRFAPVGKPQLTNRLFTRGGAIRPTISKKMRTVTKTYEVFPIAELAPEALHNAYKNWLENKEYAWADENRDTLNAFCSLFNVNCTRWEYDVDTHNYRFSIGHSETVEELKGQRLAVYITNNYWSSLFPPKQYWSKGKSRKSHILTDNSCVLTGYYMDDDILEAVYDFMETPDENINFLKLVEMSLDKFFAACSEDVAGGQSEESFRYESELNNWEYLTNGKLFN